jgi:hypothetical protein
MVAALPYNKDNSGESKVIGSVKDSWLKTGMPDSPVAGVTAGAQDRF